MWTGGALGALLLAYVVREATGVGSPAVARFFADWVYLAVMVGSTALVALRAWRVPADRRAWAVLAAGMAAWTTGDALWTLIYNAAGDVPTPSAADGAYLVEYLGLYLGLGLLVRSRLRHVRRSLWLDGLVVGLTAGSVVAGLTLGPIIASTDGDRGAAIVGLAYEAGDLALLCLAIVALGLTGWRPGRAWTALALGLVANAVADGWYSYLEAVGSYGPEGLVNTLWPLSALLLATAAWQPWPTRRTTHGGLLIMAVPGAFVLVAVGVLLVSSGFAVAADIAVAAVLAAIVRGWLTFRENVELLRDSHGAARTDALTGLGNRRALLERLEGALARTPTAERALVICDLDGFKAYNDAFGHVAGDALLSRLGRQLEAAVGTRGRAFRPGGDEFCVLLDGAEDREALLAAISAALTSRGDAFSVGAAMGVVTLGVEATTPNDALQMADARMYADKEQRRPSSQRQARDLLVRVLDEREPTLAAHGSGVAALAAVVARSLGLDAEQVDEVTRAAELHDVGKVAVPDALLHKEGPLDALEWELMRQHTVVGERILSTVAAMRPVARIVRSSHERWDGGGYPDRLAGEAIPIGARIVFLCDAYDAMTTDRPYRRGVPPEAALVEIERCAGTQFDPVVVRAFVAACRAGLAAAASG